MENNQSKIINWAFENLESELVLKEQVWGILSSQPYYDYRALIKFDGVLHEGRGTSNSQQQAIASSIAEALERYALKFNKNKYSSSGCAIHNTIDKAKIRSQQELLERHYVMLFSLGYWNTSIVPTNSMPVKVIKIIADLAVLGIEVTFCDLHNSGINRVILCQISGINSSTPFGMTFGASCRSKIEEAIESSLCEALPNVMAFLVGGIKVIDFEEFKKIYNHKPSDHLELYFNIEYAKEYITRRHFEPFSIQKIEDELFAFEEIHYPYSKLFPVIRATHPKCLNARWGLLENDIEPKNLNPNFPLVLA